MSERASNGDTGGCYEIRVQGHLHPRWTAWFDDVTLTAEVDGTTVIRSEVIDQTALQGLLRKLADLGLPLRSVTHIGPDTATSTTTD